LIESGYPSAKVDEVLKDIGGVPQGLVESYITLLKEDIKTRIKDDKDYKDSQDKGSKQFEFLDKL
jgi:hypothetical protein